MGENSGIQWTTHTFNPWVGCQRVSPGCVNCYAESYDKRVGGLPKNQRKDPNVAELRWGPKAPRVRTSVGNWKKPIAWNAAAELAGERHRVFCSSLADVFEDRADLVQHRLDLFKLIAQTPHLDWLLLTKRPENMERMLPKHGGPDGRGPFEKFSREHWPNVWLGCTVEDQQRANERIPHLLKNDAVVRFLSMEPLLERVDLEYWLNEDANGFLWRDGNAVQWIIIGGESGSNARPFDLAWAHDLVRQARAAGVAPFVKQMGSKPVTTRYRPGGGPVRIHFDDHHGGDMAEWPSDLRVREFPR